MTQFKTDEQLETLRAFVRREDQDAHLPLAAGVVLNLIDEIVLHRRAPASDELNALARRAFAARDQAFAAHADARLDLDSARAELANARHANQKQADYIENHINEDAQHPDRAAFDAERADFKTAIATTRALLGQEQDRHNETRKERDDLRANCILWRADRDRLKNLFQEFLTRI